jgi:hypothetical protein
LGTREGLRRLVAAVQSVDVLVEEPGGMRPWGALGSSRLPDVRLFGMARASLRLGTGRLGEARVEPSADPLAPARGSGAWRCVVHVPAGLAPSQRPGFEALVRTVLPGHVTVAVRYAPSAMVLGRPLAVGIGTRLGLLPAARLCGGGEDALVLSRRGLLGGRDGRGAAVTVGRRPLAAIRR